MCGQLFLVLWWNRGHLHDTNSHKYHFIQFTLGSFFQSFKPQYWWFEVAVMVYKAVLVGLLSLIAPHTPLQLCIGLLVCMAYMLVVLKTAPYMTEALDLLSFFCSLSLCRGSCSWSALTTTQLIFGSLARRGCVGASGSS